VQQLNAEMEHTALAEITGEHVPTMAESVSGSTRVISDLFGTQAVSTDFNNIRFLFFFLVCYVLLELRYKYEEELTFEHQSAT